MSQQVTTTWKVFEKLLESTMRQKNTTTRKKIFGEEHGDVATCDLLIELLDSTIKQKNTTKSH